MQALISKISYIFSIFSSSEMKLVKSKCEAIGRVLKLASTEPWDTVKAQILHTLKSILSLPTINMHDYEISYTIRTVLLLIPKIQGAWQWCCHSYNQCFC